VTVRVAPAPAARGNHPFEPLIRQHASRQGIRADLVRAVIQVESAFNPKAVSPKGAMGLMQLMPATARELGVVDPFNPAENIRGGVTYLRQLLDRYNDDEQLALAAYNAGPTAVAKYGTKIPPYKETQNYVTKITSLQGNVRNGPSSRIYRVVVETPDGRTVVSYTNVKPSSGTFEEVRR
jgi:soluble lytic murein transglycosylase-like protein